MGFFHEYCIKHLFCNLSIEKVPLIATNKLKFCLSMSIISSSVFPYKSHTGIPGLWTQELDAGLWTLDSGRWPLDAGGWTLDTRPWTLDTGRWTLDTKS